MFKAIGKIAKGVLIFFVALAVLGIAFGGGSSDDKSDSSSKKEETSAAQTKEDKKDAESEAEAKEAPKEEASKESKQEEAPEEPKQEEPAPVVYEDVTVDALVEVLKNNPLNAKNTYEGKTVRVVGVLNNIDSSGKYFSINNGDEWSFDSIQCYINDDDTLNRIASSSMGETLTVCGTITTVGEFLGYSMDVDYIE